MEQASNLWVFLLLITHRENTIVMTGKVPSEVELKIATQPHMHTHEPDHPAPDPAPPRTRPHGAQAADHVTAAVSERQNRRETRTVTHAQRLRGSFVTEGSFSEPSITGASSFFGSWCQWHSAALICVTFSAEFSNWVSHWPGDFAVQQGSRIRPCTPPDK